MPGTCDHAADVARKCANQGTMEFNVLSSLMCWDAVAHLAMLAGIIDEARWKALKGKDRMVFADALAPISAPSVLGQAGMAGLPAGQAIMFYEGTVPIHAMISLGNGEAAGTKNDCIGIGAPLGWEVLNLSGLAWNATGIAAPGPHGPRTLQAHYRPITSMT